LDVISVNKSLTVEFLLLEEDCKNELKRPHESENGTTTHPGPRLPLKVRASYNGQVKEMEEISRGTWASVSWPYVSNTYKRNGYDDSDSDDDSSFWDDDSDGGSAGQLKKPATYQLILEYKETNSSEGVLTHLSKLLDTQSMADVTFVVKNEKIDAHTIIVSGSPVICAFLEKNKFKEGHPRTVKVKNIEPAVFKEMLRYLYTGKVQKLDEDKMTEPLFLAAEKYKIKGLMDLCEQSLIAKLNMQTIFHYLALAQLHSAPQLLEASFRFLVSQKKEVWTRPEWKGLKELMKSHPSRLSSSCRRTRRKCGPVPSGRN
jgi:speckle-type POZ protein